MDTIHTLHTKSKEDLIQEVMQLRSQIAELSHQPQPMLVEQTAESSPAHQLARSNGRPISDSFADRRVPQYQGIFDASREAIFIFSMDEIILDTNQSAELIYQCPKSELIGLSAEQFCRRYGMDYHSIITALREAALSGEPKLEWEGRTPDGRYMFREVVFRKGKYMGQDVIISYGRDISDRKIAEKTIQESESRFRTIADHAPVLLRLSDETNEFYYFSKQWLQFTGRTLKKEINAGWTKCIHPDDYPMVAASLENAFRKRKNFEITYRLKRKDGSYRWLLDKGVPYFGSDHQFKGFISSAIDITERKTAEEAKQKEEAIRNADETFQRALEDINLAGIRVEKDGTISFCNAFLLQALGYERDELLGKCFFDLLVPAYEREVRREEFARALKNGGFFDTMERSLLTKDGRVRYVQFSSVVLNSHQGEISGITRIGEDITDKKKVAEVLARNQAQLQDLFDNSNDLIQIISLRGDVLFVNKAWKEKLGYKDHEIENLNMKDIVHPDYGKATLRRFRKILRGEKLFKFQTVFVSKEGKNIYLEGSVSCKYESGRPTAFRCILYDITDKIRAEKAQNLYYSIASLTIRSDNLENLYQNIHQELGKVIEVKNFYITLYNQEKNYLHFPYYVDEDFGGEVRLTQRRVGKGLTEYAMLHSQPLFLYEEDIRRLAQENNLEIFGAIPKVWLGVPMKIEGRITGIIAVKCYRSRSTYSIKDLELLDFISGQIALAIERKQNEEKLSKQTARLNAIFESGSHLMWSVNRKMHITSFNQNYADAIESQYGIKPQLGTNMDRINTHYSKEDQYLLWDRKYEAAFRGSPQYFEAQMVDKYGKNVWREVYLNPIFLNGTIEEVSGIAHDITQKKLSEIALIESEEKFRDIFESFQDIYYRSDLAGHIIMISPSAYEVSGYRPFEVIGKKITDFFNDIPKSRNVLKDLLRYGSVKNFEASFQTKSGASLQFILNMRLVYGKDGNPVEIEGVARDITELKKSSEELLQAKVVAEKSLKVKERFLANMSHEIRTPMNGIIGMIDLLSDTPLEVTQQEYVHTIKKSSETLLHILNDILDLSKIEAGKMELHKTPISLEATIEKLHALFLQQALSKKNKLSFYIEPEVPKYIIADETRLLQILSNLTANAIKFTENGEIRLHVSLESGKSKLKKLKVEVTDTGIGISKEKLSLLFNTFTQVDTSASKSYAGTGLGLVISKELSKLMNGEIGVTSEPGEGSTFWFTFEAKETQISPLVLPGNQADFRSDDHFQGAKPFILLTDDNIVNQRVASEILLKSGCELEVASNGQEALERVRNTYADPKKRKYDLIFMDIQMPDMDGVTATRLIRRMNIPNLPPIIAMTAYSMREDRERFLNAGMDDYIPKPIRANALIEKVKECFNPDKTRQISQIPEPEVSKAPKKAATPKLPVINGEVVDQLKKFGGVELVQSVFDDFITESREQLDECNNSAKSEDYIKILSNLHTLKGNAGTIGAERLAEKTRIAEAKLKQQVYTDLSADLKSIQREFLAFQKNTKDFLTD